MLVVLLISENAAPMMRSRNTPETGAGCGAIPPGDGAGRGIDGVRVVELLRGGEYITSG